MTTSTLMQQGKLAYSEKRYNDAVRFFSEALSASKVNADSLLPILDLRCQAYVKLNKHELALQDAKRMIHFSQRRMPEGYLRCSQVEKVLGNFEAALRWLEHGAKHVPAHRQAFEDCIMRMQMLIQKHEADSKRQDPLTAVPLEVIQHILSYLTYREVVGLLRVSKSWSQLVSSVKPLITTVDFTGTQKTVQYQACNAAFRRLCNEPQKVMVASLSSTATKIVEAWLAKPAHIQSLRELHLVGTDIRLNISYLKRRLKIEKIHIGGQQNLSFINFLQLIESCQTIRDAAFTGTVTTSLPSFHGCLQDNLQHLVIRNESQTGIPPLLDFSIYPNLRSLTLSKVVFPSDRLDLGDNQQLLKLHLGLTRGETLMLKLPKLLEDLAIYDEVRDSTSLVEFVQPLDLSNLHTLMLTHRSILYLLNALQNPDLPNLNKVTLLNLQGAHFSGIAKQNTGIFRTATKVHFMSEELSDHDVGNFASVFPRLESLTLETAPRVTGVFFSDLTSRPNCQLKEVILRECEKVSPDICQWLTRKGINSRLFNNATDIKGGQRVRGDW